MAPAWPAIAADSARRSIAACVATTVGLVHPVQGEDAGGQRGSSTPAACRWASISARAAEACRPACTSTKASWRRISARFRGWRTAPRRARGAGRPRPRRRSRARHGRARRRAPAGSRPPGPLSPAPAILGRPAQRLHAGVHRTGRQCGGTGAAAANRRRHPRGVRSAAGHRCRAPHDAAPARPAAPPGRRWPCSRRGARRPQPRDRRPPAHGGRVPARPRRVDRVGGPAGDRRRAFRVAEVSPSRARSRSSSTTGRRQRARASTSQVSNAGQLRRSTPSSRTPPMSSGSRVPSSRAHTSSQIRRG